MQSMPVNDGIGFTPQRVSMLAPNLQWGTSPSNQSVQNGHILRRQIMRFEPSEGVEGK